MAERITSYNIAKHREQEAMEILHELRRYAASQKDLPDVEPIWREGFVDWHKRLNSAMVAIDEGWEEQTVLKNEAALERALAEQQKLAMGRR